MMMIWRGVRPCGITERRRVIDSYASEACDARRLQQSETMCDDANNSLVRDSLLHAPMIVPCSFVPLSPRFLDGNTHRHHRFIVAY